MTNQIYNMEEKNSFLAVVIFKGATGSTLLRQKYLSNKY